MSALSFLAGVRPTAAFPTVPATAGAASARVPGDLAQLLASLEGTPALLEKAKKLLYNTIRLCGKCKKPNAFTLPVCNACGEDISRTPLSTSTNVFSAFAISLEKSGFPLTISIRYQDDKIMVIDDLLALSPLHFNVLPTRMFIPDWRYLLKKPAEGYSLIESMLFRCRATAQAQFLDNQAWRSKLVRVPEASIRGFHPPVFDAASFMCAGFNYPPSQNQLHLQFISPVLLPFQYYLFKKGVHFTEGRFFPVQYVLTCLQLAAHVKPFPPELLALLDTDASLPIERVIQYFTDAHHLIYKTYLDDFTMEFDRRYRLYQRWEEADFDGVARDTPSLSGSSTSALEPFFFPGGGETAASDVNVMSMVAGDKLALQNYGRPYHPETRKPQGTYYSYPAAIADIEIW